MPWEISLHENGKSVLNLNEGELSFPLNLIVVEGKMLQIILAKSIFEID